MSVDMDKIASLLERVTSGNAGEVYINFHHDMETCDITWKRPRGVSGHESYESRAEIFLYVKQLLVCEGVEVVICIEITQEDFLPED